MNIEKICEMSLKNCRDYLDDTAKKHKKHSEDVESEIQKYSEVDNKYIEAPTTVPECGKGIPPTLDLEAPNFQKQLFCNVEKCYINPNGATCVYCNSGRWPMKKKIETDLAFKLRFSELTEDNKKIKESKESAENALVKAVQSGDLSDTEAMNLADALNL